MLPFLVLTAASIFCKEHSCGTDLGKAAGDVGIVVVAFEEPDRGTDDRMEEVKIKY